MLYRQEEVLALLERPPIAEVKRTQVYSGFSSVFIDAGTAHQINYEDDAVVLLVYVKDLDSVVFVHQYRPAAVHPVFNPSGIVTELIAGRCDNGKTPAGIAVQEAREEAKIRIRQKDIKFPLGEEPILLNPGLSIGRIYFAYAMVFSSQIGEGQIFGVGKHEKILREIVPMWALREKKFVPNSISSLYFLNYFLHGIDRHLTMTAEEIQEDREGFARMMQTR